MGICGRSTAWRRLSVSILASERRRASGWGCSAPAIMVTASNPKASVYGSASQCAVAASIGAMALQSAMKEPPSASLARVRGNERTAKRRLSESKLKFCEALAPTIPWASQRSKTNFQRKTARAVFVSRILRARKLPRKPSCATGTRWCGIQRSTGASLLNGGGGMELP